jgi:lipid-A-disaccharide synthase-like uncharacterized protein
MGHIDHERDYESGGLAFGMRFLRRRRAEIKVLLGKNWSGVLFWRSLGPVMNSFQFLAETHVFGILIHPWKIVGLTGSLVFGLRFLIQWIASEKAKKSVIPFGFWECSALGSLLMLSYIAIYQRDSVGVLSTAMPLPIYLRNLYFRYTHREPQHMGNAPRPPA